ncbi:MAG TPA: hypothetical protein VMV82_02230 [Candidatus Dormibacteraeota bacterium]|nr:hypothetical protein [Candidatus Dormibacteraeota bacterium]
MWSCATWQVDEPVVVVPAPVVLVVPDGAVVVGPGGLVLVVPDGLADGEEQAVRATPTAANMNPIAIRRLPGRRLPGGAARRGELTGRSLLA